MGEGRGRGRRKRGGERDGERGWRGQKEGEGREGEGRVALGKGRERYTTQASITYSQYVVPHRSASEVNVEVSVAVFDTHQTVLLNLGPLVCTEEAWQ